MKKKYTAQDIQVLEDLEAVRKVPGMYIPADKRTGLHHLLFEVLDNSVDEALIGEAKNILVVLYKDGSAEVSDDGRGIPVDVHPEFGKSGVELVLTKLHAGSKFSGEAKAYPISGGLHGVGVSVVNALSDWLEVTVYRDGFVYKQRYENGVPAEPLKKVRPTNKRGTTIRFKPYSEYFGDIPFEFSLIAERLEQLAYLNPGVKFTLIDERTSEKAVFYSKKGIEEYVQKLVEGKEAILKNPVSIEGEKEGVKLRCTIQYTDEEKEVVKTFVNNIETVFGGTHLSGFRAALTKVIKAEAKKLGSKNAESITGEDVRDGLVAVLALLVPNPRFEGQSKLRLGNQEIEGIVRSIITEAISRKFHEDPSLAEKIISRVILATEKRLAAAKAKSQVISRPVYGRSPLPGKLADCTASNPEYRELYIVEGESAGGSAKQGRDRHFQAILPLKGKILNVEKITAKNIYEFLEKIKKHQEISALITAIGCGVEGENFNLSKARYRRIIIMTDADVDGSHIRTLLLTFFYRLMRPLIKAGYLYIAQPPLYRIAKGKKVVYAYSDDEKDKILKELGEKGVTVQRYKGLGEMNPQQLWETTMNPKTRTIKRVTIQDAEEADRLFRILLGTDVEKRRQFISEYADQVKNLDI